MLLLLPPFYPLWLVINRSSNRSRSLSHIYNYHIHTFFILID
jgi:hypothetical protein